MIDLAIVGSRSFKDYKKLEKEINLLGLDINSIISGGAIGADRLAAEYAHKNGFLLLEFLPNHKKYKHPYHHRNRLIAERCDILVAFWNGYSTGTKYTINYAKKIGRKVIVIKV